jgi:predicted nucleic acid-binding protein
MNLVVSDTNIWIDLLALRLIDEFLSLSWNIHSTDLVLWELNAAQRDDLESYISSGRLTIRNADYDFIARCEAVVQSNARLSLADVSVYVYAAEINAMVLTGDKVMREFSQSQGIETHGILWLLNELVVQGILTPVKAAEYLERLMEINSRLPNDECEKLFNNWLIM